MFLSSDMSYTADGFSYCSLVTSLHEDVDLGDADANICTSISSDTIRSLHAHVVAFVTDLLGRVIALREHEQQAKGHTKVWRKRDFEVRGFWECVLSPMLIVIFYDMFNGSW